MTPQLKAVQGDVATGKGAKYAKQIVGPDVEFVRKLDSLAPVYKLSHPEKDDRLRRPGYTNNVSVLIDLKGQEFQFKAPLAQQPAAIDIDIAHSVLDRMRDNAKAGGQFMKEPVNPHVDEIAFLIKQQARERALKELHDKEVLMLREGYSPEEVAGLTGSTRERLLRKYEMASPMEALVERMEAERERGFEDVDVAGVSGSVGVSSIVAGPRTMPALSVPYMFYKAGSDAGEADSMGRTAATGAPSQGFVSNRAPATSASMTGSLTTEGHMRDSAERRIFSETPVGLRSAVRRLREDVEYRSRGARGATPERREGMGAMTAMARAEQYSPSLQARTKYIPGRGFTIVRKLRLPKA